MKSLAALVILAGGVAGADSKVTVTLNQAGQDLADQIGADLAQVLADSEARINELFELQGLPQLLHSFANIAAFANHSLGVDYQPHDKDLMIGFVADSALASDARLTSSDKVFSAAVVNYGVTLGASLGRWGHPRWSVSANGSYASTTIRKLAGELLAGGAHVQYKVIPDAVRGQLRWTGLSITTGLEHAEWEIGLAAPLRLNFTVTGSRDRANVAMISNGTLKVVASTTAIPVEITTGVRLGSVFGLYGGGGLTFTTGTSTVIAQLDSTLVINADDLPIGSATVTASESDGPSTVNAHALAGVQIHTSHVRVFVQGLASPDERALSIGLRAGLD
ncbi:MAG: hypothetical protein JNL83_00575 [Myxococcales bacterium]|nr:hypothetical protein [Myxococcales bacterium]